MNIEHTYSRELAGLADDRTEQPRKGRITESQETPSNKERIMDTGKQSHPKTYSFKTVAIIAVVAFALGWAAFWFLGNRNGRFQSVKYGDTPFVVDTRTGEMFDMHGRSMKLKK